LTAFNKKQTQIPQPDETDDAIKPLKVRMAPKVNAALTQKVEESKKRSIKEKPAWLIEREAGLISAKEAPEVKVPMKGRSEGT